MIKAFSTYFFGSLLSTLAPFLLLPILTNRLSTADYGVIGTCFAFIRILDIFIGMSGTGAVLRAYLDKDDKGFNFKSYLFNAIITNLALCLVTLLPLYLAYYLNFIELPFGALLLMPLIVIFSTLKAYKHKLWNFQNQPFKHSSFLVAFSFLSLILTAVFVYSYLPDWRSRVYALVFTEAIFCIISLYWLFKEDGVILRCNKVYLFDLLKFGVPLIPHSLGLTLLAISDKLMLNSLSGLADVGILAVAAAIASLIMLLTTPLDNIYKPLIFKLLKNPTESGKELYVLGFMVYLFILVCAGIVLYFLTPWAVNLFIGEKFHSAADYVGILILGQIAHSMYRYVVIAIFFSKKTHYVSISTLASGIIGVFFQYFLISFYGIYGAAIGASIAYGLSFLFVWHFSNNLYPMPWKKTHKLILTPSKLLIYLKK
jgi:O-antigen/teichoic acid export membrane protein